MRWPLKLGLVRCVQSSSVVLAPEACTRMKLAVGDYVTVVCARRDTSVVRQIKAVQTRSSMRDDYVYVDAVSMHLLLADVDDDVDLLKSDISLDMP